PVPATATTAVASESSTRPTQRLDQMDLAGAAERARAKRRELEERNRRRAAREADEEFDAIVSDLTPPTGGQMRHLQQAGYLASGGWGQVGVRRDRLRPDPTHRRPDTPPAGGGAGTVHRQGRALLRAGGHHPVAGGSYPGADVPDRSAPGGCDISNASRDGLAATARVSA